MRLTKAALEAECLSTAEGLLVTSLLLDDSDSDEDSEIPDDDSDAEDRNIFELIALHYVSKAAELAGDGTRGPYNQEPRSADFFDVCRARQDWQNCNGHVYIRPNLIHH